ncbi:MAG: endonuclease domain-containing protein [Hyphomonadaceae bacterium]
MSRFAHTLQGAARARDLRRAATKAERMLWAQMRGGALGAPFRRQHPIGPYFADFCCVPLQIVVELDGSQHAERDAQDRARTAYLEGRGFLVLRFWNNEITNGQGGPRLEIMDAIRRRKFERNQVEAKQKNAGASASRRRLCSLDRSLRWPSD